MITETCAKCGKTLSWEKEKPEDPPEAEFCQGCGRTFCPECIVWAEPYDGDYCKDCQERKSK